MALSVCEQGDLSRTSSALNCKVCRWIMQTASHSHKVCRADTKVLALNASRRHGSSLQELLGAVATLSEEKMPCERAPLRGLDHG